MANEAAPNGWILTRSLKPLGNPSKRGPGGTHGTNPQLLTRLQDEVGRSPLPGPGGAELISCHPRGYQRWGKWDVGMAQGRNGAGIHQVWLEKRGSGEHGKAMPAGLGGQFSPSTHGLS